MRLEEFDGTSAAERRVKGLKANADAAKRQAKQLKANADLNAERLRMRQSREKLAQLRKTSAMSTVKPRR
jgi:hypothetical protein